MPVQKSVIDDVDGTGPFRFFLTMPPEDWRIGHEAFEGIVAWAQEGLAEALWAARARRFNADERPMEDSGDGEEQPKT